MHALIYTFDSHVQHDYLIQTNSTATPTPHTKKTKKERKEKCQNCSWCRSFTFVSIVISETPSCNVDTVSDAEDRKSVCVTVSNTWADYNGTSPNQFMTRSQCSVKVSLFISSWWQLPLTHHSVIAHSLTHWQWHLWLTHSFTHWQWHLLFTHW